MTITNDIKMFYVLLPKSLEIILVSFYNWKTFTTKPLITGIVSSLKKN